MKPKFFLALFVLPGFLQTANAQLEQVWKTDYQITSDTFNTFGYKTDSAGNFYLYGWQHNRVFLQKHDPNGNIKWTMNDDSIVENAISIIEDDTFVHDKSNSRITDISFDGDGNIYIAGTMSVKNFGNPNYVAYTFYSKINTNGILIWKKNLSWQFDTARHTTWSCNSKVIYNEEHKYTYVIYSRIGIPTICGGGLSNTDFAIAKSDSVGNLITVNYFLGDTSFCSKDISTSLIKRNEDIILSGFSRAKNSLQPQRGKIINIILSLEGNFIKRTEENEFSFDPYENPSTFRKETDSFSVMSFSKENTTYTVVQKQDTVEGSNKTITILKYDGSYYNLWKFQFPADTSVAIEVQNAIIDDSCNLLVSCVWKENGANKVLFLKLDSSGQETFRDTFTTGVEAAYCFINRNGQYLIPSSSWNGSSYATSVRKYTPSGELILDSTLIVPGKVIHGWVDSSYIYLVLVNGQSLSYLKFKDKDLSIGLKSIIQNQPTIYPNPANDFLSINTPNQESQAYSYRIYGVAGNLVAAGTASNEISLMGLLPGLYILTLTDSNNRITTTKIIKR